MACKNFYHDKNDCFCCPPRPAADETKTLTFSNCVPVSDTSNTVNNVVYFADPDIDSVIAGSIENTGQIGFNANFVFNSGPSTVYAVQPGDSISFVYDDLREIALTGFSPTEPYTGIFKYQVTYSFDV